MPASHGKVSSTRAQSVRSGRRGEYSTCSWVPDVRLENANLLAAGLHREKHSGGCNHGGLLSWGQRESSVCPSPLPRLSHVRPLEGLGRLCLALLACSHVVPKRPSGLEKGLFFQGEAKEQKIR